MAKIFILYVKQRSRKYKWAKQHEFLHLIMKYKIHLLFLYLHTHFSSKSSQQQHRNFAKGVGPSINGRVSVGVIKEGVLGSSKYSIKNCCLYQTKVYELQENVLGIKYVALLQNTYQQPTNIGSHSSSLTTVYFGLLQ